MAAVLAAFLTIGLALPVLPLVAPATRLAQPPRRVLSNSFAFGGSNAVLALERR